MAVAHWRNNQVTDQRIDRRQCLRDTASVGAVGDIQFCSDFLMRQLNQAIATVLVDVEWIAIPAGYKCGCQAAIDLPATAHGFSNNLVRKHTRPAWE